MRFEQRAFWDNSGRRMRRVVRYRLLRVASAFILHTKINPSAVVDVQIVGSAGSKLFHKLSDVDLHVLFNPSSAGMSEEMLRNTLDGKQQSFNLTHEIEAFGHHVEVYGQLEDEVNASTDVYSLLSDEWLKHSAEVPAVADVRAAKMGFMILAKEISAAIEEDSDDPAKMTELMDYIKALRKQGLERSGEMGIGNLIFKILRANGQIDAVSTAKTSAQDRRMSMGFKESRQKGRSTGLAERLLLKADKVVPDIHGRGVSVKDLPELLLSESVRGEYWVIDGETAYCDGDVGDVNHEGYATQHAMSLLADHFNVDYDRDRMGFEDLMDAILEEEGVDIDDEDEDADSTREVEKLCERDDISGMFAAARGSGDIRFFAMKHWGWHAIRGDHAETYKLTPEAIKEIAEAYADIAVEEGNDLSDDDTLTISAYEGGRVDLTREQIESGDYDSRPSPVPEQPARSAAVDAMDKEIRNPFYKGDGD